MLNISVQQLRSFHALMKIGNMTRAAEYLCTTQPTVSRHLQLMETELGFRAFDRKSGGRLIPTKEGHLLYERLKETLDTIDSFPEIARGITHYENRRLKIAATTPLLNSDVLIEAIKDLRVANPNSILHLERARREHIEGMVANGTADIGLCAAPITNTALKVIPLLSTVAVAVVSRDHPLADRKALSTSDVTNEELILPTAAPIVSQLPLQDDDPDWRPPPVRVHLMLTGLRLAEAGFGVLISDPLTATTFRTDAVRLLAWEPEIQIEYCILVKKDFPQSETTTLLINGMIASANTWREVHADLHDQSLA